MIDKVQKIKEWISKTQDGLMDAQGNFEYPEHEGAYHILCNLDTYIDSLQEEPKKCMYALDDFNDEDRKVTCDGCEEDCKYAKLNTMLDDALSKETKESWNDRLGISQEEYGKVVDECIYGKEPELVDDGDLPKEEPSLLNKQSVDEAMAEIEKKAKLFTEANEGKTSEEILAEMRGEEPVSEDLKTELDKYIKDHFTIDKEQLDRFGLEEKDYMYSMDKSDMLAMVHHFVGKHQEPVSEDLEKAMQHNAPNNIGIDDLLYWRNGFITGAKWQKEKEYTCYEEAFEDGAKWKVENLWKPADGDDLPIIDREVIVLVKYNAQRNIHDEEYPTYRVGFGHRPNPDGWDGKNIDTNEVTHYTPKLYDKGGWNAPDIAYWLDYNMDSILKRNDENNKIDKR